jgi:hypothetical protein
MQPFCVVICLDWPYEGLLHGVPLLVNYRHGHIHTHLILHIYTTKFSMNGNTSLKQNVCPLFSFFSCIDPTNILNYNVFVSCCMLVNFSFYMCEIFSW